MLHVEICEHTRKGLKPFVDLPFHLYRGDPNWVPPLLPLQTQALLGENNLFGRTSRAFILWDDGLPVARVLAGYDEKANIASGRKDGSLALFECAPGLDYAKFILDEACAYLKAKGITHVTGPDRFTADGFTKGLLTDGYEYPPVFLNPYNPPAYRLYFEKNGFTEFRKYYAFRFEMETFDPTIYGEMAHRAQKRFGFHVSHVQFNKKNEERLSNDLFTVLSEAFPDVAGFIRLNQDVVKQEYRLLKEMYRPEMTVMAYSGKKPIGFLIAFPDYNTVLKMIKGHSNPISALNKLLIERYITGARCNLQFVVPEFQNKGVNSAMMYEVYMSSRRLGMRWFECSAVDERNTTLISSIEHLGCKRYKTYSRFEKDI